MTAALGTDVDCPLTPSMLKKVAYAGAHSASFQQAAQDLSALAEANLSRERMQRWAKRIGQKRVAEVESLAQAYEQLPLPAQQQSPGASVPEVACVQMDGGRIPIRDRAAPSSDRQSSGHWRETLVDAA